MVKFIHSSQLYQQGRNKKYRENKRRTKQSIKRKVQKSDEV